MTRDASMAPAQGSDATGDVHVIAAHYEVRRVLGRGGMGVVYECENTWTHRRVAVKVLDPARSSDPVQVERFMREARAASALRHPNVVDVLDMGQDARDGALYIVQELLVGEDLRALIERDGAIDEARTREIIVPVLRALAAAHSAGIVHRDIKPANLFLARGMSGEIVPKVIDFGIARDVAQDTARTSTGETIGTPAYMAPEQLRAEKHLTPAVDVWAVGVVIYEMLTGDTPFPSDNYNVLVHRVLGGERPPLDEALPHVSRSLRAIIDRALEPAAAKRFADASAMLQAIESDTAITIPSPRREVEVAPAVTTEPEPATPAPTIASPARSRRVPAVIAALAVAAIGVAVALSRSPEAPPVTVVAPTRIRPDVSVPSSLSHDATAAIVDAAPAVAEPAAIDATVAVETDASAAVEIDAGARAHGRSRHGHASRAERDAQAAQPAHTTQPTAPAPDAGSHRPRLLAPGGSYPQK